MKIALMSGAYGNAGDFLIESRSTELLKRFIPQADIEVLKRNVSYNEKITQLNSMDIVVFGGGGRAIKRNYIPMRSRLLQI